MKFDTALPPCRERPNVQAASPLRRRSDQSFCYFCAAQASISFLQEHDMLLRAKNNRKKASRAECSKLPHVQFLMIPSVIRCPPTGAYLTSIPKLDNCQLQKSASVDLASSLFICNGNNIFSIFTQALLPSILFSANVLSFFMPFGSYLRSS